MKIDNPEFNRFATRRQTALWAYLVLHVGVTFICIALSSAGWTHPNTEACSYGARSCFVLPYVLMGIYFISCIRLLLTDFKNGVNIQLQTSTISIPRFMYGRVIGGGGQLLLAIAISLVCGTVLSLMSDANLGGNHAIFDPLLFLPIALFLPWAFVHMYSYNKNLPPVFIPCCIGVCALSFMCDGLGKSIYSLGNWYGLNSARNYIIALWSLICLAYCYLSIRKFLLYATLPFEVPLLTLASAVYFAGYSPRDSYLICFLGTVSLFSAMHIFAEAVTDKSLRTDFMYFLNAINLKRYRIAFTSIPPACLSVIMLFLSGLAFCFTASPIKFSILALAICAMRDLSIAIAIGGRRFVLLWCLLTVPVFCGDHDYIYIFRFFYPLLRVYGIGDIPYLILYVVEASIAIYFAFKSIDTLRKSNPATGV